MMLLPGVVMVFVRVSEVMLGLRSVCEGLEVVLVIFL